MLARPAAAAIAALALAPPAAATAAPSLAPLKPCYVSGDIDPQGNADTEAVMLSGQGFTPDSLVDVAVDGATAATSVPIDAAGNLPSGPVNAPFTEHGPRPFGVTVTEQGNPAQTVTATSLVTHIDVFARPPTAPPWHRIRLSGRGFTADAPIWGHYIKGGHVRRTVRLAAGPTGPCGRFHTRRRQFPFRPARGLWLLQIDQQQRWEAPPPTAWLTLRINVQRRIRPGR